MILVNFSVHVAKTPTYPIMCPCLLFVALCNHIGWLCCTVVEHWSLDGKLSLSTLDLQLISDHYCG